MGMSTHVIGFRPPDAKWKKMKAIYDSCIEAEIDVPDEVDEFFDGEPPDERGIQIDLQKTGCIKKYKGDMVDGYEVEVAKIPKDVTFIRVYNSY